jgi:UDP-N-acetylglucosamine 3-dehydrogenase
MGQRHLKYLNQSERVREFYVVDPVVSSVVVAEKCKGIFSNLEEALAVGPQWAVVAVSTPFHFDVGVRLLRSGVATLMEKPLAPTFEQSRELVNLSRETGTPLFVGHIERFNPGVRALRTFLKSGAAGTLQSLHITRYGPAPVEVLPGNNVVVDLTVHDIDIIYSLGFEPILSSALNLKHVRGYVDHSDSLLELQDGALASLSTSWRSPVRKRSIRALCSKGIVEVNLLNQKIHWEGETAVLPVIEPVETLGAQLSAFWVALDLKSSDICPAHEAASVVRLAEDILLA